jgi:hypothetical protein
MSESGSDERGVEQVLHYLDREATPDVRRTVERLQREGWVATEARGGSSGSGNAVLHLEREGWLIQISRDRGQWMMDIRPPEWPRAYDLDVIVATASGDETWQAGPAGTPLPQQLPVGVGWDDVLPNLLHWMGTTDGARSQLDAARQRRADALFG